MKMKSILSGLIVVCAACMFLTASRSQASNKPTEETPMAIASVRYIVNSAIEFYTKLTELASVRYLIDDTRAAVDFYTTHLGFTVDLTAGQARALVAAELGLISLVIGGPGSGPLCRSYWHRQLTSRGHRGPGAGVDRHEPRWVGSCPLPPFPQRRLTGPKRRVSARAVIPAQSVRRRAVGKLGLTSSSFQGMSSHVTQTATKLNLSAAEPQSDYD